MKQGKLKMIISPAKKMKEKEILPATGQPRYVEQARELLAVMQTMTGQELQTLWKCNDAIAEENCRRIRQMDLSHASTPAILAYEGIQYKYMAPAVFEEKAYAYLQEHLYILSGFYGALKPFDGVRPYRLEMQARFHREELDSLYTFWGEKIADAVLEDGNGLVNLASREYSKAVMPYIPKGMPCVTCVFGEVIGGKVKEKGTYAKMARGEMVRFMAENQIETIEELKMFARHGYHFSAEWSTEEKMVFIR